LLCFTGKPHGQSPQLLFWNPLEDGMLIGRTFYVKFYFLKICINLWGTENHHLT
jgi:hypothetical protein